MEREEGARETKLSASLPPTALSTALHEAPGQHTAILPQPTPLPEALFSSPQPRVPYPSSGTTAINASPPMTTATGKRKRTFKVILLGDAGVGKTCLSFRFCNGRFPEFTEATIGVDFRERSVHLDGETLRVQLWDTAGQERYRHSIVAHYYRNVHAVVFAYDVTCPRSFQSLGGWLRECEKHGLGPNSQVPRIMIGNKCDIEGAERVSTDSAQVFADLHNMAHFETSAKKESETDHVESIFMTVVHHLRRSKAMHVQSEKERNEGEGESALLLTAQDADKQREAAAWCC